MMTIRAGFEDQDQPSSYEPPHTADEILRRYATGERFFPDADIPEESSLCRATLAGAIFKEAMLHSVDFRGADLRGVQFIDSNVKCSDFRDTDLRGAVFTGTCVEATVWDGANVEGADFAEAFLYGSPIRDPEFPFGKFEGRA
jgi:uncharacterized protein YjbI with pentapeptide repeats